MLRHSTTCSFSVLGIRSQPNTAPTGSATLRQHNERHTRHTRRTCGARFRSPQIQGGEPPSVLPAARNRTPHTRPTPTTCTPLRVVTVPSPGANVAPDADARSVLRWVTSSADRPRYPRARTAF
eukprot:7379635-Prymnesium_polylepis.1